MSYRLTNVVVGNEKLWRSMKVVDTEWKLWRLNASCGGRRKSWRLLEVVAVDESCGG